MARRQAAVRDASLKGVAQAVQGAGPDLGPCRAEARLPGHVQGGGVAQGGAVEGDYAPVQKRMKVEEVTLDLSDSMRKIVSVAFPNAKHGHSHASETGHSIARPIACGNRVPPQRTLA